MNLLLISGRLGQDAETKYTASGIAVCSFSVAVDSGWGDNKKTSWFRCSLFGKRAEGGLVAYLVKGQQVIVTGSVDLNEYESKGVNKASLNVFVDKVELTGGRSASSPAQQQEQGANHPTGSGQGQNTAVGAPADDFLDSSIPF